MAALTAAQRTARADAIRAAGRVLAAARARTAALPAEQVAALAYVPGGPTVAERWQCRRLNSRRGPVTSHVRTPRPTRNQRRSRA